MGWTEASGPHVIISADTVVEHGGRILEKPADEEEAVKVRCCRSTAVLSKSHLQDSLGA